MYKEKWDLRFLALAKFISCWSKDPSTKCGSVIADPKNRIVSLGYNGYPSGIPDDESLKNREEKYLKVIHAEVNAILFASRKDLTGCSLYIFPLPPCPNCAGIIIQTGIKRVVCSLDNKKTIERWKKKLDVSLDMFKNADVSMVFYKANRRVDLQWD